MKKAARVTLSISAWALVAFGALVLLYPGMNAEKGVPRIVRELWGLVGALEEYRKEFGRFPEGDAAAVSRALEGENPKHLVFFEPNQSARGPSGELLDPWGTPYRFYFSDDRPLVRSAGKNRQFDHPSEKGADDVFSG